MTRLEEQVRSYSRDAGYGYCLGSFPVLELLRHRPQHALQVVLHPGMPEERSRPIRELCAGYNVQLSEDAALLRRFAHRKDVDALALFGKYRESLDWNDDHLALVSPGNPGNLGTILRTAAAFGVNDIALLGPSVDPWNPHVIRASIGARFLVRVEEFAGFEEYRSRRGTEIHMFTGGAGRTLPGATFPSPFTLLFGPEWPGLPEELERHGTTVAIPQDPRVESLNVAVAAGVALYAARHGNSRQDPGGARLYSGDA